MQSRPIDSLDQAHLVRLKELGIIVSHVTTWNDLWNRLTERSQSLAEKPADRIYLTISRPLVDAVADSLREYEQSPQDPSLLSLNWNVHLSIDFFWYLQKVVARDSGLQDPQFRQSLINRLQEFFRLDLTDASLANDASVSLSVSQAPKRLRWASAVCFVATLILLGLWNFPVATFTGYAWLVGGGSALFGIASAYCYCEANTKETRSKRANQAVSREIEERKLLTEAIKKLQLLSLVASSDASFLNKGIAAAGLSPAAVGSASPAAAASPSSDSDTDSDNPRDVRRPTDSVPASSCVSPHISPRSSF